VIGNPFSKHLDVNDVMTGQVGIRFDAIPATLKRSPLMPEVPTIAEAGCPGFEAVGWIGIVAPAKTPRGSSTSSTPRSYAS
jgi:hypothetical protein